MDKKFLYIALAGLVVFIILLVVLLSGRGKEPQEITLTFWNLEDEKSAFDQAINTFQEANPNVTIEYVKKNRDTYLNEVLEAFASGRGPDILAIPNDWLPKYHILLNPMPAGRLADKKAKKSDAEVYRETYAPVAGQDNIIDGQIYGFPLAIETLELFYNQKIFEEALTEYRRSGQEVDDNLRKAINDGPKTWDDFSQMVQLATQKSGTNVSRSAAALGVYQNIPRATDILTLLMLQHGVKMTADDNSAALFHTSQNAILEFSNRQYPGAKALELYASFGLPQNPNYTWNDLFPEAIRAFAEEKTAMMIDYSSAGKEIKRLNPDLGYAKIPLPQVKEAPAPINFASYLSYSVNRNSLNSALAWEFIFSFTSLENSQAYQQLTGKTSSWQAKIPSDSPVLTAQSWFRPDPQKSEEIFREMINQANAGQAAQTTLDNAAAQITTLLGELNQ